MKLDDAPGKDEDERGKIGPRWGEIAQEWEAAPAEAAPPTDSDLVEAIKRVEKAEATQEMRRGELERADKAHKEAMNELTNAKAAVREHLPTWMRA